MFQLNNDIILYICNFLKDVDVMTFLSSSTNLYNLIKNYTFNEFHDYNKAINKSYFDNFTAIKNYEKGTLPIKIKKLIISYRLAWEEVPLLPENILYLEINYFAFNHNCLPKFLIGLNLGYIIFNREDKLPYSIKFLKIKTYGGIISNNVLPDHLEELTIYNFTYCKGLLDKWPNNLKKMKICNILSPDPDPVFTCFPLNLTYLDYDMDCDILKRIPLPKNLISLTLTPDRLGIDFMDYIPASVKNLYLNDLCRISNYNDYLKNIPQNIKYIEITGMNNAIYFGENLKINNFKQVDHSDKHHEDSMVSLYFERIG